MLERAKPEGPWNIFKRAACDLTTKGKAMVPGVIVVTPAFAAIAAGIYTGVRFESAAIGLMASGFVSVMGCCVNELGCKLSPRFGNSVAPSHMAGAMRFYFKASLVTALSSIIPAVVIDFGGVRDARDFAESRLREDVALHGMKTANITVNSDKKCFGQAVSVSRMVVVSCKNDEIEKFAIAYDKDNAEWLAVLPDRSIKYEIADARSIDFKTCTPK